VFGISTVSAKLGAVTGSTVLTVLLPAITSPAPGSISPNGSISLSLTGATPGGTVKILDGNTLLATITADASGNGTKSLTLAAGAHSLTTVDVASGLVSTAVNFIVTAGKCDINQDGAISIADVQLIVNEALGLAPAVNDLDGDNVVDIVDVQIEINADLGLGCAAK
jgi:hypothetical protein